MEISTILTRLAKEKILPSADWNYTAMTGGTMSQVYLLRLATGMSIVIKINEAEVTESEADFLAVYHAISLVPKLLVVDSEYRFMAYTYIPGFTDMPSGSCKKKLLQALVSGLINWYQPASSHQAWGWRDAPAASWQQFLVAEVKAAEDILALSQKVDTMRVAAPWPNEQHQNGAEFLPYLIHGDCGVHNFIFRDGGLAGVIDPTPVLGWPHYDVIYAFFSTPHDLTQASLDAAFEGYALPLPESRQFYSEVLIGLYQRIAICMKHHPADLPEYLLAWEYWTDLIGSQLLSINKSLKDPRPTCADVLSVKESGK